MIVAFTRAAVALALLPRLTAGAMYAGEAREMAKTLIEHKNSKSARRFKRLREELSSRTAGRDL